MTMNANKVVSHSRSSNIMKRKREREMAYKDNYKYRRCVLIYNTTMESRRQFPYSKLQTHYGRPPVSSRLASRYPTIISNREDRQGHSRGGRCQKSYVNKLEALIDEGIFIARNYSVILCWHIITTALPTTKGHYSVDDDVSIILANHYSSTNEWVLKYWWNKIK